MSKIDGFVPNVDLQNKTVFLTGVAGFIGSQLGEEAVCRCSVCENRRH